MLERLIGVLLVVCGTAAGAFAQQTDSGNQPAAAAASDDTRAQYPAFLTNSYFSVSAGYLGYTFGQSQLQPGFQAASITVPHAAVRVALFGHEFGPHVSGQVAYMRPVQFVNYTNVNGDGSAHHVWTGFGSLTLRGSLPLYGRLSVYGEGGLAIVSRHGFTRDRVPVVADQTRAAVVGGAGLDYRLDSSWSLTAGATYSPSDAQDASSSAWLLSSGFRYTMRALTADEVQAKRQSGVLFPANMLQIEVATGSGYGISTFLATRVPIFWAGSVKVNRGVTVHYDRNVFHTARLFALDFGTSLSTWRTRGMEDRFVTLSVYPLFRFTPVRTRLADMYFCYSLAGPTYISRRVLDGLDTGSEFTFQDFLGAGIALGPGKRLNVSVTINHYSNGNISGENAAVSIPLTFGVGWTF